MKKLLLIISSTVFCSLAGSCQSSTKTTTTSELKPKSEVKPTDTGTTKNEGSVNTSGSAGNDKGITKGSGNKPDTARAIIHNGPNQSKVDSLKNIKTNNKRKKKK